LDLANDLRDLIIDYSGEAGSVAHLRKVVVDRLYLRRKALFKVLERARFEVADRIEGDREGLLGLLLVCLGDIDALQEFHLDAEHLAVSKVSRTMQRVAVRVL
jgi:hypothetical protein